MAITKTELQRKVKRMDEQRHEQYQRIQQLEAELDACRKTSQEVQESYSRYATKVAELTQEVLDLKSEVAARRASEVGAQRRFDLEREEHMRTQTDRYNKMERIRELEKLLVHGGKTIGALTDLAAEKYKHDDLPF